MIGRLVLLMVVVAAASPADAWPFGRPLFSASQLFSAKPTHAPYTGPIHPAVCRVSVVERDGMAFGSGTLIDARDGYGLVITNWHVVRDATGKIEVRFPSGFTSEARPLKIDETWDLAALVVWRPPTEPAPLAASPPQPGDTLTICGYGQGDYLQQTGRCTEYYSPEVGQPRELVELDVQARQGDSGGPIFNDRGELAGVLFGATRGSTLGSFGGRVQTFLATLAPDIGTRSSVLVAAVPTPPPALMPERRLPAADPFVAAERTPPPALTDRSEAPRLAASRLSTEAWRPAPRALDTAAPPRIAGDFARSAAGLSASPPQGFDLHQDAQTLLALVGVAALVVAGMRALA